jgi:hypothetical protein
MQVKPLESHHELIGDLSEVVKLDAGIKLVFSINKEILVPASIFSEKELQNYRGCRIGLINIDGVYRIRLVSLLEKDKGERAEEE